MDAHGETITRYCKENRPKDAHRLLISLKDHSARPTAYLVDCIVKAYVRIGDELAVLPFFLDIRRQGVLECMSAVNVYVSILCNSGALQSAWDYLKNYHNHHLNKASVNLKIFHHFLEHCKDTASARQYLLLAKETFGLQVTSHSIDIVLSTTTNGWIILEIAQDAFQKLSIIPTPKWLVNVLEKASISDKLHAVEWLLESCEANFGIPANWNHFAVLLKFYAIARDVFAIIDIIRRHKLNPSVDWLNSMTDVHLLKGNATRLDLAEELIRNLPEVKWNAVTFNAPLREASTMYNMEKVQEYFAMMHRLKIEPQIFAWNCLLRCEYNINGPRGRDRTIAMMQANNIIPDNYTRTVLKYNEPKRLTAKLRKKQEAYRRYVNNAIAAGRGKRNRAIKRRR